MLVVVIDQLTLIVEMIVRPVFAGMVVGVILWVAPVFVFVRMLVMVGMTVRVGVLVTMGHAIMRVFVRMGVRVFVLVIMGMLMRMRVAHRGLLILFVW